MESNVTQGFCNQRRGQGFMVAQSQTCFTLLDLLPYKFYEKLAEKLTFAIEEIEGFGQ